MSPLDVQSFEDSCPSTVGALAALIVEAARKGIGVSGVHVMPVFPSTRPFDEAVHFSEEHPASFIQELVVRAMPWHVQEIAQLGSVYQFDRRMLDVGPTLGWSMIERTVSYNEYWVRMGIERQLVAGLGTSRTPLGFLCVSRKRSESPFSESDYLVLDQIRTAAEVSMRRIADRRLASQAETVLQAFSCAMDRPYAVFDHDGQLLWMNDAAVEAFGVPVVHTGGQPLVCASQDLVSGWAMEVRECQRHASATHRKEGLCVRRIDRFAAPPIFLVAGEEVLGLPELSKREHQVAEMACRGYSALNIASHLDLAEGTVRNHLKRIYRKLGVRSRAELAHRLLRS